MASPARFQRHGDHDGGRTFDSGGHARDLSLVVCLAADPGRASLVPLFLPDWHNLLDPFDGVPAGFKCLSPMSRRYPDDHAGPADLKRTGAMDDGHPLDIPTPGNLLPDALEHFLSGGSIGLVFKFQDLLAAGVAAHRAGEKHHGPGVGCGNHLLDFGGVQWLRGHPEPLVTTFGRTSAHRWNERQLISLLQHMTAVNIFLVHHWQAGSCLLYT